MAVIKPFRGIRYNPERFENLQAVVSQPYDKIDPDLQQRYYDLSPYNIVRIIQGQTIPGDLPGGPNNYTRARDYYHQWLDTGILVREDRPAFYAYEQTFNVGDQTYVRLGLIAAVELTGFDEGIVLPHERTHKGPKEDRLRLLSTLQANTEQIFMLYPDEENIINGLIRQAIGDRAPDIDITEIRENDVQQHLWIITDPAILDAIQAHMAPKRNLIIADGHHRYETGLTYRDQQRAAYPDAPPQAAFNYIAAMLVSMDDPGLVILPTHREICHFTVPRNGNNGNGNGKHSSANASAITIPQRAQTDFTVEPVPDLATCLNTINAHPTGYAFGFYGGQDFYVLTLKDHRSAQECGTLAVSILHHLLIEQIAGVPVQGVEDKTMIRYHRSAQEAVDNVNQGAGDFVFFLSPTRMENIKACASLGATMPQKSTDFYPKVISGLAILPVGPDETL
ncbi:MAG: DUF1015 domain-containing protein [Anaerolineae bacterium]|nr:DUF1015 domain-containing protein [Anaerolineae bacterium]